MNNWLKHALAGLALATVLLLSGCGGGTKQQMMDKIAKAETKDEVTSALGSPGEYNSTEAPILGKVETLTYEASDGTVVVTCHNGKVFAKVAGGEKKE